MIAQLRALDKLPPLEDIELKPDLSNMQPRVNGAAMSQMMFAGRNNYRRSDYATSFFRHLRGRRKRQAANFDVDSEKGQGHAVYCWKAGEQGRHSGKNLHHICSACRSIRVLPSSYFPRYLNQVECIGGPCLNGEGVCTKQFMFVNVLKNTGTDACQRWEKAQIRLAVCCDCMLKKESRLYGRVLG
uniref:Uncharacterized protein n=1 Tax=Romanomermis culicivorax TaxID=13658 RepID=A0A915KPH8_ROMCU